MLPPVDAAYHLYIMPPCGLDMVREADEPLQTVTRLLVTTGCAGIALTFTCTLPCGTAARTVCSAHIVGGIDNNGV